MKLRARERIVGFGNDGGEILEITIQERAPYSNRSVPIVFTCTFNHDHDAVVSDFGDFKVKYEGAPFNPIFRRDVPWKAVATDLAGRTIAEAVGIRIQPGGGVTFRETHYKGGGACFSATSSMDWDGVKREETEAIGQKNEDYFFLWPTTSRSSRW